MSLNSVGIIKRLTGVNLLLLLLLVCLVLLYMNRGQSRFCFL